MPNYVTDDYIAQYMQVDANDAAVAADLAFLIEVAESLVDLYCGTSFAYTGSSDTAKYFDGTGTNLIPVNPVLATLTKVELVDDDNSIVDELETCVKWPTRGLNGMEAYPSIMRKHSVIFPQGIANIKVTGKFGIATTPSAIKLATALTVKYLTDLRMKDETMEFEIGIDRHVKNLKEEHVTYLPTTARKLLERWRVADFGRYFGQ